MSKTLLLFGLFAACVPLANYLVQNVGTVCIPDGGPCLIPVGFGLMAPSGVLLIGLALVLRDLLHQRAGWLGSMLAVGAGGSLALLSPGPSHIALASALAFVLAELADLLVYAPLRRRNMGVAVLASGAVGAAVDSVIFVLIAFGSIEFALGTILAKFYASAAFAAYIAVTRQVA